MPASAVRPARRDTSRFILLTPCRQSRSNAPPCPLDHRGAVPPHTLASAATSDTRRAASRTTRAKPHRSRPPAPPSSPKPRRRRPPTRAAQLLALQALAHLCHVSHHRRSLLWHPATRRGVREREHQTGDGSGGRRSGVETATPVAARKTEDSARTIPAAADPRATPSRPAQCRGASGGPSPCARRLQQPYGAPGRDEQRVAPCATKGGRHSRGARGLLSQRTFGRRRGGLPALFLEWVLPE